MKIASDNFRFNVEKIQSGLAKHKSILLLHGFSNSSSEWQFLKNELPEEFQIFAIDLLGHGKSSSPDKSNSYSAKQQCKQILDILDYLKIDKVILAGYSMGGRLAINFALDFPDRVQSLILESTTPGINDRQEKIKRIANDTELAKKILDNGIDWFVKFWLEKPIFSSLKFLPPKLVEDLKKLKQENNKIGLANSLIGFGTGIMDDNWERLAILNMPVLIISGELDEKFSQIGLAMQSKIKNSVYENILGCGHNTHLEKPDIFIKLVNKYFNNKFL